MIAEELPVEPSSILVADDDDRLRTRVGRALQSRGFDVRLASTDAEAIALATPDPPEYALVDLAMPTQGGLAVLRALKALDPSTNVVVLTGYGSVATALEAIRLGATHYLAKPADVDDVLAAFARTADMPFVTSGASVPSLARVEWEHIQRVLSQCGGNISQAAKLLGLHRRSLQRKLGKLPTSH